MNSKSVTSVGIKACVNMTVTYSTAELEEQDYNTIQWLSVVSLLEKCAMIIIVLSLSEPMCDTH
jgi:hypothetical protein